MKRLLLLLVLAIPLSAQDTLPTLPSRDKDVLPSRPMTSQDELNLVMQLYAQNKYIAVLEAKVRELDLQLNQLKDAQSKKK